MAPLRVKSTVVGVFVVLSLVDRSCVVATVAKPSFLTPPITNKYRRRCATSDGTFVQSPLAPPSFSRVQQKTTSKDNALRGSRFDEELNDRSAQRAAERRASGGGVGETATGAILGGLLGGPFGALFGAQIGASFGSARNADRARREEMERMGVTPEMLEMAKETGVALDRAVEGLKATKESLETQQAFARMLDQNAEKIYEQAKVAMAASDEEQARTLLMERQQLQERLKKALLSAADERKRLGQMDQNVAALEERAMEVEALLRRSVGAKTLQDTAATSMFSLEAEDPLLRKFRDLEKE